MENYDPNRESSYIMYFYANNLYGWAMSQPLLYRNFRWVHTSGDSTRQDWIDYINTKNMVLERSMKIMIQIESLVILCTSMQIISMVGLCPNLYFTEISDGSIQVEIAQGKIGLIISILKIWYWKDL